MNLQRGHQYIIRTLTPPQRLAREHCLTYVGKHFSGHSLVFDARPIAGTQILDSNDIVSITVTHDATPYLNKIVRAS